MRAAKLPLAVQALGPAMALPIALGFAAVLKARLASRLLEAPVSPWRWALVWAAAAATVVGTVATWVPEWMELAVGVPAILGSYGWLIWRKGFTAADRILFKRKTEAEG
jgi:hypothetical protein